MADETEVSGVVLGPPGEVIAGWSKLGERGTRRTVAATVTLRADDGTEVKLLDVVDATIGPIVRRTAEWQEIEAALDPLSRLCVPDAPAPDAEVELITAALRGGDRVAAWGTVSERGFAADAARADGAFRTAAEATVVALKPAFVGIGNAAAAELERLRYEHAKSLERSTVPVAAKKEPAPAKVKAKPARPAKRKRPAGVHDRLAATLVPWIVLAWIAAALALAVMVPGFRVLALVLAGIGAGIPLAYDVGALPPFRVLPPGLRKAGHPASVTFLIVGGLTIAGALWSTVSAHSNEAHERASAPFLRGAALVGGVLTIAAIGWCITATRGRRRVTNLLVRAAPHPQPIVDGVWGATDGTVAFDDKGAPCVNDVPHAVTDGEHIRGTGSRDSDGVWSGSDTKNLTGAVAELEVLHADGRTRVATYGGLWWSAIRYDRSTPDFSKTDRADVIPKGAQLRVVGRAKGGVLAKGGAESLLLFAVPAERDVAAQLRALRRRDLVAVSTAVGGIASIVAGLVSALVG